MGAQDSLIASLTSGAAADVSRPPWAVWIDSLAQPAWIVEGDGLSVCAANAAAHALLARAPGALVGTPAAGVLCTPEDIAYWAEVAAGEAGSLDSESLLIRPDGEERRVARSVRPFVLGGQRYFTVVLTDLTASRRAEEDLEQTLAELRATLESTGDGILVTDLAGRVRAFNRRFAQMWAVPQPLLAQRDDAAIHDWLRRSVDCADSYDSRLRSLSHAPVAAASDRLRLRSKKVFERVARPLWFRGAPMGRVFVFRDLSERVAADQRIAELSHTDALTGLPNRAGLAAAVERAGQSLAQGGAGYALMLVDLDRFGAINETLGASLGDLVLLDVTRRLRATLRQGDLVARVGGDQFALLVHKLDERAAEIAVRRILGAVSSPAQMDGLQFTLTCSIGVAFGQAHGQGFDELFGSAEEALRRAKAAGRGSWRLYSLRHVTDPRLGIRMDHLMRQALAEERFRLHYQPQVDMRSGGIVGAEALLRWSDPEFGGEVSPARFVPVAEQTGLIVELGAWAMGRAVEQAARWLRSGTPVPVAVNVSALQFRQPAFVEQVAAILTSHGLPAQWLELEVTESILVSDAEDSLARLHALARLGVRLSIDDFGTGYSSLAYLKRLPIQHVKIDRSFVAGLPDNEGDAGIVTAIVQMARALRLDVIAEGVETDRQRRFLQAAGCVRYQGFLFAPPVDAARFERLWRLRQARLPESACG